MMRMPAIVNQSTSAPKIDSRERTSLRLQDIADAADRVDELLIERIVHFLPEPADGHIDHVRIGIEIHVPHLFGNDRARQDLTGTANEAADSASSIPAPPPSSTPGAATTVTCDFSNPGYSGWCRVTKQLRPGKRPRGFCSQVLACLNDVRCIRTYCNATTIRGGWRLEKVETAPKAQ